MHQVTNRPATAATDVTEFVTDLDGGQFELILSQALSESAAAAVDFGRQAEVTVKFKIEQIMGTHQVRVQHDTKFSRPTSLGKLSQETSGATVLHVGKYGALSLAQPSLLEKENRQQAMPGL
jgi:hypothetical protein